MLERARLGCTVRPLSRKKKGRGIHTAFEMTLDVCSEAGKMTETGSARCFV